MKKNAFFTFCFACIPGAGQMYLGYMKRGVSIMSLFAAILAIATGLYADVLTIFLPVIWAYSFFDTWRIYNMTPEQAQQTQDDYILHISDITNNTDAKKLIQKRHKLIGYGCILLGAYVLFESILRPILYRLDLYALDEVLNAIPSLVVAVLIVLLGVWLVRGPSKADTQDGYKPFEGDVYAQNAAAAEKAVPTAQAVPAAQEVIQTAETAEEASDNDSTANA